VSLINSLQRLALRVKRLFFRSKLRLTITLLSIISDGYSRPESRSLSIRRQLVLLRSSPYVLLLVLFYLNFRVASISNAYRINTIIVERLVR
jgi:hypothetical protein